MPFPTPHSPIPDCPSPLATAIPHLPLPFQTALPHYPIPFPTRHLSLYLQVLLILYAIPFKCRTPSSLQLPSPSPSGPPCQVTIPTSSSHYRHKPSQSHRRIVALPCHVTKDRHEGSSHCPATSRLSILQWNIGLSQGHVASVSCQVAI